MYNNWRYRARNLHYISSAQQPKYPSDVPITANVLGWSIHSYRQYRRAPEGLFTAELIALKLAIYFRESADYIRMTQYIALAMMHHERRRRDDTDEVALDFMYQDINFEWLFKDTGKMSFLGAVIADPNIDRLYIDPQTFDDSNVFALAYVLQTKPKIEVLALANQFIKDEGALALAKVLRHHPGIKTVTVVNNEIGRRGQQSLKSLPPHINISMENQRTTQIAATAIRNKPF